MPTLLSRCIHHSGNISAVGRWCFRSLRAPRLVRWRKVNFYYPRLLPPPRAARAFCPVRRNGVPHLIFQQFTLLRIHSVRRHSTHSRAKAGNSFSRSVSVITTAPPVISTTLSASQSLSSSLASATAGRSDRVLSQSRRVQERPCTGIFFGVDGGVADGITDCLCGEGGIEACSGANVAVKRRMGQKKS